MRFKLISRCLLFAGLSVSLTSGELWLKSALAQHHKTQIIFSSTRDRNPQIYVMDSDGTNHRRLAANQAENYRPACTSLPTGRRLRSFPTEMVGCIRST